MIRFDHGRRYCDCDQCTQDDSEYEEAQNARKQLSAGICEMLARESWVADLTERKLYCALHASLHPEAVPVPRDYFHYDVDNDPYSQWLPVECYHGDCDCMHEYELPPYPY